MAKGTKHKADWKETTLQVVIDAKRIYCHSMKIMDNFVNELRREINESQQLPARAA